MNAFTRRSFLKGILSLAASAAIPIELIEKATVAINTLPEVFATAKKPAGYFKINELIVPITWLEISQPMGDIYRHGDSYFRSPPELSELCFMTYLELPERFMNDKATFIISDKYLPFELTGNGYFSSRQMDCIVVNSNEPLEYTYCLSCEIDQYKQEEYIS